MARFWMTGIDKRAVLQGGPSSGALAKKKRKNRTAAKTRAMKKARAAYRAVAVGKAVLTTQGRCEGMAAGTRTSEAAGSIAVTALQGVELLQPSPHVTEVNAVISDTDQTAATSSTSVTNQTDSGTDRSVHDPAADWLCMICTFMNCDASATCANCKCDNAAAVVDDVTPDTVRDAITVAQLANVTNQMTTATIREITDTIQKDNETDHGSTRTDQMYFPIYGEYYTGRDVTVDANYATTTETWQVACINDRRQTHLGLEFRVLWVHPDRSCRRLYLRTWEPRARLAEDDFEVGMDLVDRWKASKFDTFEEFWKLDKVDFGFLGADGEGLCLFNALKRAAQLAGRPDVITQQDIDQFFRDKLVLYQRNLSKGATWTTVLRFLRRLRDASRDFIYNAIAKYNYAVPGRRGARVLDEIELNDGIYIVAVGFPRVCLIDNELSQQNFWL